MLGCYKRGIWERKCILRSKLRLLLWRRYARSLGVRTELLYAASCLVLHESRAGERREAHLVQFTMSHRLRVQNAKKSLLLLQEHP
jgi:hypothetical protein